MAYVLHWDDAAADVGPGGTAGLRLASEFLLGESSRLVPLEEGTLDRSGVADVDGDRASVSYDTVYACRQHEELTWRHDPGRQAKYLEAPFNSERDTMLRIIAQAIQDELGA